MVFNGGAGVHGAFVRCELPARYGKVRNRLSCDSINYLLFDEIRGRVYTLSDRQEYNYMEKEG